MANKDSASPVEVTGGARSVQADPATGEVIFPIGSYNGLPYYLPPVGFDEAQALKEVQQLNDLNADLLGKLPENQRKTGDRITASFIYGHPADYHGLPMLCASVNEWRSVFLRFRRMHIDTVIFQTAIWYELKQCFYRSKAFAGLNCYGVIERMLEAAEAEGMHVYLGGFGSDAGWKENCSQQEIDEELDHHRKCFAELCSLGRFDGMYFPSETAFQNERKPKKEARMNFLYRFFSDMVKAYDPALKILVSPATMHDPKMNGIFKDFWNSILAGTHIDILMPQDSIGTNCTSLDRMDVQWKAWKEVADSQQLELWSHTEIFERHSFRPENSVYPASPERVSAQLALTAPYVKKHCCWEALYFTSDLLGVEGRRMREFLESGKLY